MAEIKPVLKWKKPVWRNQKTHCGRYFVSGSECGKWFSYHGDDEFPFGDACSTRWEAKLQCEQDAAGTLPVG